MPSPSAFATSSNDWPLFWLQSLRSRHCLYSTVPLYMHTKKVVSTRKRMYRFALRHASTLDATILSDSERERHSARARAGQCYTTYSRTLAPLSPLYGTARVACVSLLHRSCIHALAFALDGQRGVVPRMRIRAREPDPSALLMRKDKAQNAQEHKRTRESPHKKCAEVSLFVPTHLAGAYRTVKTLVSATIGTLTWRAFGCLARGVCVLGTAVYSQFRLYG